VEKWSVTMNVEDIEVTFDVNVDVEIEDAFTCAYRWLKSIVKEGTFIASIRAKRY
jgi:hypothetical protein